jgi:V8-like Glu-specific endopeptidase
MPEGAIVDQPAAVSESPEVGGGIELLGYSYPAPYTRYEVFPNYKIYPFTTVGKLFFKQGGISYVCSAASIGNYAIWTAGHCVHAGDGSGNGGFSTNVVFVPAYKNGAAPYGQWTAAYSWVSSFWSESGNPAYDIGGFVLGAKAGKRISQKVGSLGFAWNFGVAQHWFVMGYPAAPPFTGGTMQNCASSYAYSDVTFSPATSGVGCDLTSGISGGPWIMSLRASGGNYLNGQSTYRYIGFPQELFSPYFGDHAHGLYQCLVSSTPTVPKCN